MAPPSDFTPPGGAGPSDPGPDATRPVDPASPGHLLPLPDNPHEPATDDSGVAADGFFYALLQKRPA